MKTFLKTLLTSLMLLTIPTATAQTDDELTIPVDQIAIDDDNADLDLDGTATGPDGTLENSNIAQRFGNAEEQNIDFLGLPFFDAPGLWKLLILFGKGTINRLFYF